jgi:outer membrane protein assembly factor BamB
MKQIKILGITLLFLLPLLITSSITAEDEDEEPMVISAEQYENGYRYNIQGWIYVYIEGDPYERGFQHGYLLAEEIVDILNRWSHIIHNYKFVDRMGKRLSEQRYEKIAETWWDFCVKQNTRLYWDKYPEEYKEEIDGIADGVNARGGELHGRDVTDKDILAMNQMYEFMSKLTRMSMGVHPLRTFFHQLQRISPVNENTTYAGFLETFLNGPEAHHCNGFIATGDATTDGQMVFSHSTIAGGSTWWYTYYIALRWNVILDILPTNGHRMIISTSPGLIWSDEDYYQNSNGIVFLETTCPQGLFDNKGLPLSIRARTAVQYSESIDNVIYHLRYGNDGSMNAVWLIGDMKTGEICRFELGYSSYAIWRTFDGFYWSANNPIDRRVSMEKFYLRRWLPRFLMSTFLRTGGLGYNSIRYIPEARDRKFNELGEQYYGEIDVEIVKEIMATSPIPDWISDIKITDTALLNQNGLWAHYGNPTRPLEYINPDTKDKPVDLVQPTGWVRLFGIPDKSGFELQTNSKDEGNSTTVLWSHQANETLNAYPSSGTFVDGIVYLSDVSGKLYAFNISTGVIDWIVTVGDKPTAPVYEEGLLVLGHREGISALDLSGIIQWDIRSNEMISPPIIIDDRVVFGDCSGDLFVLSKEDGTKQWQTQFSGEVYLFPGKKNMFYITANQTCYALDIEIGDELWNYSTNGTITSAPLFVDDMVIFSSWDTCVYAVDAKTGELMWMKELGWGSSTCPVFSNDLVLVASHDNNVYAFHKLNGSIEWIFSCNAAVQSQPVVYGEFVFFGSDDGRLYAVNTSTGVAAWSFAPASKIIDQKYNYITTPVIADPIVGDEIVVIGINGTVYGLKAQTQMLPQTIQTSSREIIQVQEQSMIFIVVPLLVLILATTLYVLWAKKRIK